MERLTEVNFAAFFNEYGNFHDDRFLSLEYFPCRMPPYYSVVLMKIVIERRSSASNLSVIEFELRKPVCFSVFIDESRSVFDPYIYDISIFWEGESVCLDWSGEFDEQRTIESVTKWPSRCIVAKELWYKSVIVAV